MTSNTIDKLVLAGFKKKWASDKSAFWFEKKVKHPLLGRFCFVIEDSGIYLAWERGDKEEYLMETTTTNINKVLKQLERL